MVPYSQIPQAFGKRSRLGLGVPVSTRPPRMRAVPHRLLLHRAYVEGARTARSESCLVASFGAVTQRTFGSDDTPSHSQKRNNALQQQHWLDRRLPGLREWLQTKNRQWWLKGMQAWYRYASWNRSHVVFTPDAPI